MRRHLAHLVAVAGLGLGWALIAAACGGSSTNSNPTASGGNTATATSGGGGSTSNANELPQAGPEWSAFHLLDAAGYAAALGEAVTAVEDDGVVPDSYGCEIGRARALTAAGALISTTLWTTKSVDDARQEYSTVANFLSTPPPSTWVTSRGL
jgi:hypothetical protein